MAPEIGETRSSSSRDVKIEFCQPPMNFVSAADLPRDTRRLMDVSELLETASDTEQLERTRRLYEAEGPGAFVPFTRG